MRIDSREYGGLCVCGREHPLATRLCVIEPGALTRFEDYMAELSLRGKRCAVYDRNTYNVIPEALHPQAEQEILLAGAGLHADEFSTAAFFEELQPDVEVIIAIGGGPLHDIVRFCSKARGIPFVSVPTAASCDGFSAEVAAMTWEGIKKTMSCQAPDLVVADTDIIRAAPGHLILSGIGDVLGKFIALAEWKMANAVTGEFLCPRIWDMMHQAVTRIWDNCVKAVEGESEAVAWVVYGLLLSGIAMQMFGNSRPASGAEHHMSHLIEIEPEAFGVKSRASHGEKVGVGTILASAEYHHLAEIEDIRPLLKPYEPIDQNWVRSYFGETLYEAILAENENDCLAAVTPEMIAAAWPEMRKAIAQIPEADALQERMAAIGAKTTLEDIGVPPEKHEELLRVSPIARNRLTLMRMRRMMKL